MHSDELPKQICVKCLELLCRFFEFRRMIATSQRTLEESARHLRTLVRNDEVKTDAVKNCDVDNEFIGDESERNRPFANQLIDKNERASLALAPTRLGGLLMV